MHANLQQFLNALQLMSVGIFLYHAMQVRRLSRVDRLLVPYTGVIPMSLAAASYYLALESFHYVHDPFIIRIIAHWLWMSGCCFVYFQVFALQTFLQLRNRTLWWCRLVLLANIVLTATSLLGHLAFGRMLLFDARAGFSTASLPEHVTRVMNPNAVAAAAAFSMVFIEVVSFLYFLNVLIRRRGDRWLGAALLLSLAAVINDLVVSLGLRHDASILFVANLVEIYRLTVLIERANRERLTRMEESMRLSQIGELTTTFAHELNTPLAVIIANSQKGIGLLRQENLGQESAFRKLLESMHSAAERLLAISQGLRQHARQSERVTAHVSTVPVIAAEAPTFDLGQSVREAVGLVNAMYAAERIELQVDVPTELLRVPGDRGRFEQILINLLQNARDATAGQESRRIDVRVSLVDQAAHVEVIDNGCGISPEHLARIFTPFFTTKPRGRGTGIGLSFVASQVKAMNGEIAVASQPGQGATFQVSLPIVE